MMHFVPDSRKQFCIGGIMQKKGFKSDVLERIREAGWEFSRHVRHDVYVHPERPDSLIIPNKLVDRNMANRILRQAHCQRL